MENWTNRDLSNIVPRIDMVTKRCEAIRDLTEQIIKMIKGIDSTTPLFLEAAEIMRGVQGRMEASTERMDRQLRRVRVLWHKE